MPLVELKRSFCLQLEPKLLCTLGRLGVLQIYARNLAFCERMRREGCPDGNDRCATEEEVILIRIRDDLAQGT